MQVAAVDGQPRPLGRADEPLAEPEMPADAPGLLRGLNDGQSGHYAAPFVATALPALRRTISPT